MSQTLVRETSQQRITNQVTKGEYRNQSIKNGERSLKNGV